MRPFFFFTRATFVGALVLFTVRHAPAQETALKAGDPAPGFTAVAYSGDTVRLSDLVKRGDVVLFFYRGSWCPYCRKQVKELQDSLGGVTAKGAQVIGISPETTRSMERILDESGAAFPLIHDEGYAIMDLYGVSFRVDEKTVERYRRKDLGVGRANDNEDYILPVPATFVIGRDGII
jgi:peroxiredoxin